MRQTYFSDVYCPLTVDSSFLTLVITLVLTKKKKTNNQITFSEPFGANTQEAPVQRQSVGKVSLVNISLKFIEIDEAREEIRKATSFER